MKPDIDPTLPTKNPTSETGLMSGWKWEPDIRKHGETPMKTRDLSGLSGFCAHHRGTTAQMNNEQM